MNFYALSALFNLVTAMGFGALVLHKNPRGRANIAFAVFSLAIIVWSAGYYFWQVATDAQSALFYTRVLMAGAIFIPITYVHFTVALIGRLKEHKQFLILSYLIFFAYLIVDSTNLFVSHVEPALGFQFWPKPGVAFHFFLVTWLLYLWYVTKLLLDAFKTGDGLMRLQIKYVFFGVTAGSLGGITNYFLWYGVPIPPVGNVLSSLYAFGMGYSIIKYRLLDIRTVAVRSIVYLMLSTLIASLFTAVSLFVSKIFD